MNPTRVTSCPEGPKADRHRRKENGKRLWDKAGAVKPGPGGHQAGRTSRRDDSRRHPVRLRRFTNTAEEKEQRKASVPSQTPRVRGECSLNPSCHRRPDGGPEKGTVRRAAPSRLPRGLSSRAWGSGRGAQTAGSGPRGQSRKDLVQTDHRALSKHRRPLPRAPRLKVSFLSRSCFRRLYPQ